MWVGERLDGMGGEVSRQECIGQKYREVTGGTKKCVEQKSGKGNWMRV